MYDFDAMEAVDDLIDEINEEYASESTDEIYEQIYDELCERVECGELTMEEAEIINEAAAEKYLTESTEFGKQGRSISKRVNKNVRAINRQYKKARSASEYQAVVSLCESTISDIDAMIEEVRSYKETSADKWDFYGHQIIGPMITTAISCTVLLEFLGAKAKDYKEFIVRNTVGAGVGSAAGIAIGSGVNKAVRGEKGDKSPIFSYKSKILAFLRSEKKAVLKIKAKAESKVA